MPSELAVEMGSDAYASCFCHALSTEHEEIMGLLLGTFSSSTTAADSVLCKIYMSMVLIRSDKRKDRVEIPAETMAGVASEVEKIAKETGISDLQVVGWYHSHPHITALPSHVDLGTQMNYQLLDSNFIGLIFSVFNRDSKTLSASEQVCCFQSVDNRQKLIPFRVVPSVQLFVNEFSPVDDVSNGLADDGDGSSEDEKEDGEARKHAAVMRLATGAIATIFQLYLKEEQEAYSTVEERFDYTDGHFNSADFVRRVSNGAALATAITKIVSICHDNQVEAVVAKTTIGEVRVEALKIYRDALKNKVAEREKDLKKAKAATP